MTDTLRELWDRIDAGVPPVAGLAEAGERVQRRRRWTTVAAAACSVVVVVAAGAAVQQLGGGQGSEHTETSAIPPPPDGMRWVGLGRVVVAVPDWWTTGDTQCLSPIEDTVYFETGAITRCGEAPSTSPREVSALAVIDATTGYGEQQVRAMRPVGTVSGREVLERDGCEERFEGVCRRVFAVPSEGVVFAVSISDPGDADYDAIRDSLRILPESMTVVPLADNAGTTPTFGAEPAATRRLQAAIEAAGLQVELVEPPEPEEGVLDESVDFSAGTFLDVSPALGSPIDVGGTVTVTVAGPTVREIELPTSGWEPGDMGRTALIRGEISLDEDGCVRLGPQPDAWYAVWPKDFRAETRDGVLVVIDADGREYVEGTRLRMGGGYWSEGTEQGACLPPPGTEVAHVESTVEVTGE
jgi:hypothetical protein